MGEKNPTEEKRMTWRGRIKKQGKRKSRTITPERYKEVFKSFPKTKKKKRKRKASGRATYTTDMAQKMTTRYEPN